MKQHTMTELCDIFYEAHGIPAGIFSADNVLIRLFSDFGENRLQMYLNDCAGILDHDEDHPVLMYDADSSCWCCIPQDGMKILLGPVQTGRNPSFRYEGIREYTPERFRNISLCLLRLLQGKEAVLKDQTADFAERKQAEYLFETGEETFNLNSYDEIYECVRTGDLAELELLLETGSYTAYLNRIITNWNDAYTVYHFNLAKTYHAALGAGVPITELAGLVELYLRELKQDTSLAAIKSGMRRMLYDFTRYVNQYSDTGYSPLVNMALMYIKEHIYETIEVKDIAAVCSAGISTLQHRFRQETGLSLTESIRKRKAEKACYYLRYTAIPCGDIAYRMGYCSQSYFIRQFKQALGMTPAEYRSREGRLM